MITKGISWRLGLYGVVICLLALSLPGVGLIRPAWAQGTKTHWVYCSCTGSTLHPPWTNCAALCSGYTGGRTPGGGGQQIITPSFDPKAEAVRHYNKALELIKQNRLEEASSELWRAIDYNPRWVDAQFLNAHVLDRRGHMDVAIRRYELVLELDPNHAKARNRLDEWFKYNDYAASYRQGISLSFQGRWEEAEFAFRRAIASKPNDWAAHESLGSMLEKQGKDEAVADAYRKAIQLAPGRFAPYSRLGELLERLGEKSKVGWIYESEAAWAYRKALQIDPNLPDVRRKLARLEAKIAREQDDQLKWAEQLLKVEAARPASQDKTTTGIRAEPLEKLVVQGKSPGQEARYSAQPREYKPSGLGLIGGMTWIYGYNVPPGKEGEKLRETVNRMHREQMKLAGVKEEEFLDPNKYNFILGVAASHGLWADLTKRVVRDQWGEGQFSAANRELYASLKNRQFDRLDCHSNGAMVCLAALELGDVKTRHVRLLGPQITGESVSRWQKLIQEGRVSSIELYINKGDPVPWVSYSSGPGSSQHDLYTEIKHRAPGIYVKTFDCPFDMITCHNMNTYQANIETQR